MLEQAWVTLLLLMQRSSPTSAPRSQLLQKTQRFNRTQKPTPLAVEYVPCRCREGLGHIATGPSSLDGREDTMPGTMQMRDFSEPSQSRKAHQEERLEQWLSHRTYRRSSAIQRTIARAVRLLSDRQPGNKAAALRLLQSLQTNLALHPQGQGRTSWDR